jgi:gliding motility-associated-like protein
MKKNLFFCFVFLSLTHISIAQCTNPKPIGTGTQIFCKADAKTVGDIVVSGSNVVWYEEAIGGVAYNNLAALATGLYYANNETGGGCSERLEVQVFVYGAKPNTNLSISECARDNPTIANLFPNGGSIEWFADEVGGSPLSLTYPLEDGKRYWAQQTENGCVSLRSDTYVELVETPAPIISVSQETQTFCNINNPRVSDLVATLNNPNSTLLWYSNIDSPVALDPTELLVSGNEYWAAEIEPKVFCESLERSKVSVIVNTTPMPTVTTTNDQTYCEIDAPTVANLNVSGTAIKWYASLTSMTVLSLTDVLVDGSSYFATQTDAVTACESSERARINVTINSTPKPTVAIGNDVQQFCKVNNATIANIVIEGTAINWYASLNSNTVLNATDVLLDGTDYYATKTDAASGCESLERTKVSIKVTDTAKPIVANADSNGDGVQVFCKVDALTIADIDITGNDIKWYASLTSTTVLEMTDLLLNGTDYYATQTDATTGCESSERTKVSITVNATSKPIVPNADSNGDGMQVFCKIDEATIADIDITGNDIKWYASLTSTSVLDVTDLLLNGTDYYATQTDATTVCESSERTKISIVVNETPKPTVPDADADGNGTQVFCIKDASTIADIVVTGTDLKWYETLTSTTVLALTDVLLDGTDYYVTQTDATTGCESSERAKVTVTVIATPKPIVANADANGNGTQVFCQINAKTIADLDITGTNIKWYDSLTSTTVLALTDELVNGVDYYATQTGNLIGCESVERTKVTVTITNTLAPIVVGGNSTLVFCESDSPTLANLEVEGTSIKWYETLTSTVVLDNAVELEDGKSYFASQTNSEDCESASRLEITVSLTQVSVPTITLKGNEFCVLKGDFTLSDLSDNVSVSTGNTIIWYDDFPNGTVLSLSDILVHNTKYFALSEDANGCKSMDALEVVIDLEVCEDSDLIIYDGFSPNDDGINDLFPLKNIELLYPNYIINFYNRWGNIVYEGNANKPYWNGKLKGTGKLLPKGIYFYIIDFKKNSKKPKQGRLYLSR